MHRTKIAAALLAVACAFAGGAAIAQEVEVEVQAAPDAYYDDVPVIRERAYGPRVYGYERRADDYYEAPRMPYPVGGCGTYHFWDGYECRDARNRTTPAN